MTIYYDTLYGAFQFPGWLTPLIQTPEFQRLRGIRLINSPAWALPSLSECRRYSHTIGLLHLGDVASRSADMGADARRLLLGSLLSHDIGTPPFGHVVEYQFAIRFGWTHDQVVASVLDGTYRAEGRYHQIIRGFEIELGRALEAAGINRLEVSRAIRGEGEHGPLVSSRVDLDNVDNVWRMAHLLGIEVDRKSPARVAAALVTQKHAGSEELSEWKRLRRLVYEVLAFDPSNIAGQAMITDLVSIAMDNDYLGVDNWFWTDEQMLFRLLEHDETAHLAQRILAGRAYSLGLAAWYDLNPKLVPDLREPSMRRSVADELSRVLRRSCSIYALHDQGTFEKPDALTGSSGSQSVIIGVCFHDGASPPRKRREILAVLQEAGFPTAALKSPPQELDRHGNRQASLPI